MNAHTEQVDITLIHILEQQIERHSVVDVVTHIGFKDDSLRFFLTIGGSSGKQRAAAQQNCQ